MITTELSKYGDTKGCRRMKFGFELHIYELDWFQIVLNFAYWSLWINLEPKDKGKYYVKRCE